MITQKLKEDIVAILENKSEVDESIRSAAIGALGVGLGAVGAYNMTDKTQPEPTPQVQQGEVKPRPVTPQAKAPEKKKNQFKQAVESLSEMEQYFVKKALENGIEGIELVAFLAQAAHETAGFSSLKEQGTKKYFRRYEPKYNPKTAKILGNVKPGDGEKYKGRGFVQLTGRDNYKRAGIALGLPLEDKPHLLETPSVGFKASLWYWQSRVKNKIDEYDDVEKVTKLINGGLNGLDDRKAKFERYLSLLTDN